MHEVEIFRPTLTKLVEVLNRVGVRFHLTGGVTAVAYGEPRMTQDIDLVIDSRAAFEKGEMLLRELAAAGFHLEEQTARTALADLPFPLPRVAMPPCPSSSGQAREARRVAATAERSCDTQALKS